MSTIICNQSVRVGAWAAVLVLLLQGPAAFAQTENEALARGLFNEGRRLMNAGQYDEACPKLEAARRLYPGSGVLLNLGLCYERSNRAASAWTVYGEAVFSAQHAGRQDDEAEAKRRQAAIESRVPHLTIAVSSPARDLVVHLDGRSIDPVAWGSTLVVDAGPHQVAAEAPGRVPWASIVVVSDPTMTTKVQVPELVTKPAEARSASVAPGAVSTASGPSPAPQPAAMATTEPPSSSLGSMQQTWSYVTMGVGVAAIGAGAVIGLVAKGQDNSASKETGAARFNDSTSAVHLGDAGSIVAGVGGVIAAAGLTLWLTAPKSTVTAQVEGTMLKLGTKF
jgi:hypothetical protein